MGGERREAARRLRYLEARVRAADRAPEVLRILLSARTADQGVADVAALLGLEEQDARGVVDNWGTHLSRADRAVALQERDRWRAVVEGAEPPR